MERFARVKEAVATPWLQRELRVENLDRWCDAIDRVLAHQGERGEIYCIWGQFRVHREVIKDGVRFSLPGCPNALQWSVTRDQDGEGVTVHCTINRADPDPDFTESIEIFVEAWRAGLQAGLELVRAPKEAICVECPSTFSGMG